MFLAPRLNTCCMYGAEVEKRWFAGLAAGPRSGLGVQAPARRRTSSRRQPFPGLIDARSLVDTASGLPPVFRTAASTGSAVADRVVLFWRGNLCRDSWIGRNRPETLWKRRTNRATTYLAAVSWLTAHAGAPCRRVKPVLGQR